MLMLMLMPYIDRIAFGSVRSFMGVVHSYGDCVIGALDSVL